MGTGRRVKLPDDFRAARSAVEDLVDEAGWVEDADHVLLAVQEAMTNAVRHGRGVRHATAYLDGGALVVEVADNGDPFDAGPYVRAAPDAMVERGRGLWLMTELTTSFDLRHEPGGNVVTLSFGPTAPASHPRPVPRGRVAELATAAHPLFDAIAAAIVVVDDQLIVCEMNSAALNMFGLGGRDEAVDCDLRAVLEKAKHRVREPDEFVDRLLYLHAHPGDVGDDLLVLADGSLARRRSFPVREEDGRVVGRLDAYSRVGDEATVIAAMQRALLPELPAWPELDVGAIYHPASTAFVGGDFYDFVELPGGARCVVIGDVSGRGASAAAASATVRAYLRASLQSSGVTAAFADVDRAITRELGPEEFVTLGVVMEEAPGIWTALVCGHERPLLYTGGEVQELAASGSLLGIGLGGSRVRQAFTLAADDVLLLYTDGVTDAGFGRDRFGVDSLRAALVEAATLPAQQVVASIDKRLHDAAGGRLADDHALVAVKVR